MAVVAIDILCEGKILNGNNKTEKTVSTSMCK